MDPGFTPSQTYLRVGSGGKGVLLGIAVCLRPLEGKQLPYFTSVPAAVAFEQILTCSLGPCCTIVIAVLSVALQPVPLFFNTAGLKNAYDKGKQFSLS